MTTSEKIVEMLKNIDGMYNRTTKKECLYYDKVTFNEIVKKGYVTLKGNLVSREFYGKNYELYF
jgi:hypothetical protein